MNQRFTLLALHLTGVVGPRRLKSAKVSFPNLSDIFGATENQLAEVEDWTLASAKKVLSFQKHQELVEREIERAESKAIHVLVEGDKEFPKVFENIYDPPFVLWKT